jgi:hypothetical protein
MPVPYFPTHKDGRHVKEVNELKVLKVLRLFGHLRRQELAVAVWPTSSPASAYTMACRTVTELLRKEQILERRNTLNGSSFVLSSKGVSELRLKGGVSAQEGYTLAFDGPQFFHRTLGTSYLLEKARTGHEVFGEYAVIKSMAPVTREFLRTKFKKVPDGLIVYSSELMGFRDGYRAADWVEVESAYKNYEELEKSLLLLTRNSELTEKGNLVINKLVFVYDSRQKHDRFILRAAKQFLKNHPELVPKTFLSEIVLARCFVAPPFSWQGVTESTAFELMEKEHFQDHVNLDELSANA